MFSNTASKTLKLTLVAAALLSAQTLSALTPAGTNTDHIISQQLSNKQTLRTVTQLLDTYPDLASHITPTLGTSATSLATAVASATVTVVDAVEQTATANTENQSLSCSDSGILGNGKIPGFIDSCVRWGAAGESLNGKTYERLGSGGIGGAGFHDVTELIDTFQTENLEHILPGFNPNKPNMEGNIYFDGVKIHASYKHDNIANTNTLAFSFLYEGEIYTASMASEATALNKLLKKDLQAVSNESIDQQLNNFFKSSAGTDFLTALLKATVEEAPYSPIAGNPASYMSQLVENDYALASRVGVPGNFVGHTGVLSITPNFSSFLLGTQAAQTYTLPVDYTRYLDKNDALIVDFPLGYTKIGETSSYNLGLGIGWKHRFKPYWSVTPALHFGVGGSADLGSGTLVYDGSITSHVIAPFNTGPFTFGLTDNLSYLKTGDITVSGYKAAYNIDNVITENGLDAAYRFNNPISLGFYYNNTTVLTGQKWYMGDYNQIGFTLNTKDVQITEDGSYILNRMGTSLAYVFGPKNLSGIMGRFTYNF